MLCLLKFLFTFSYVINLHVQIVYFFSVWALEVTTYPIINVCSDGILIITGGGKIVIDNQIRTTSVFIAEGTSVDYTTHTTPNTRIILHNTPPIDIHPETKQQMPPRTNMNGFFNSVV